MFQLAYIIGIPSLFFGLRKYCGLLLILIADEAKVPYDSI